ncbi:MAG: response regulator [Gammaproteobacteria bacterium]|nr:response regulator [Gammaproteobacteria bacterium]MDH3416539.1 response regulator [Gammaproteobacteria bacterium]
MKRILLVDDEPMVLRVMRGALEREGFEVDVAVDGETAWMKIAESRPDVLVTDIEMPVLSGRELCQRIQEELPDREFPIFVSTSLTALEHREWSKDISLLVFLEKPISIRKLRSEISKIFDANTSIAAGDVR